MILNNFKDYMTTAALNILEISGVPYGSCTVSLHARGKNVFEDDFFSNGYLKLYGLGDILAEICRDAGPFCSFKLEVENESGYYLSKEGTTIVSDLVTDDPFPVNNKFLCSVEAMVVPEGAKIEVRAVGSNIPIDGDATLYYGTAFSQSKAIHYDGGGEEDVIIDVDIDVPQGVAQLVLGDRKLTFFVVQSENLHELEFTNCFNATEKLYLSGKVETKNTRESNTLSVGGRLQEYDITSECNVDFEAKGVSYLSMIKIDLLPFARNFKLNTVPIIIKELKPEFNRKSNEAYSFKFSANLATNSIDINTAISRIFTPQYSKSFK